MTHGHGLRWGNDVGMGGYRVEGNKGEAKWDNYNSIINKIHLKNNRKQSKHRYNSPVFGVVV